MSLFKTVAIFQIQNKFLFFFIFLIIRKPIMAYLLFFILIMNRHQFFI